jgi:hypothetical protein
MICGLVRVRRVESAVEDARVSDRCVRARRRDPEPSFVAVLGRERSTDVGRRSVPRAHGVRLRRRSVPASHGSASVLRLHAWDRTPGHAMLVHLVPGERAEDIVKRAPVSLLRRFDVFVEVNPRAVITLRRQRTAPHGISHLLIQHRLRHVRHASSHDFQRRRRRTLARTAAIRVAATLARAQSEPSPRARRPYDIVPRQRRRSRSSKNAPSNAFVRDGGE